MHAWAKALSPALALAGILALLGPPASAQQFSADLIVKSAQRQPAAATGKLYVGGTAVLAEIPGFSSGRFLIDIGADAAFFVIPPQRIFMDAKESSRLTQILVAVDPRDPCEAWQAMAKVAGVADRGAHWQCHLLGADAAGGHAALKYRAISPRGDVDYAWIDPQLKFAVEFQFADGGGFALDHIREGTQPAALFTIPTDYRKFDPQRLIERIKQSDVWVDPPKQ